MLQQALLINAIILFAVLEADIGPARKVSRFRIVRPLLTSAAIVPLFLKAIPTHGTGLALEIGGAVVGALLGLSASGLMHVRRDAGSGRIVTRAGWAYGAVWVTVIGARTLFSIGSQKWFPHALGTWMAQNHVTSNAIVDTLIMMAVAMTLARTLSLGARAAQLRQSARLTAVAA